MKYFIMIAVGFALMIWLERRERWVDLQRTKKPHDYEHPVNK